MASSATAGRAFERYTGDFELRMFATEPVKYTPGTPISLGSMKERDSGWGYAGKEVQREPSLSEASMWGPRKTGDATQALRVSREVPEEEIIQIPPKDILIDQHYSEFNRQEDEKGGWVYVFYRRR